MTIHLRLRFLVPLGSGYYCHSQVSNILSLWGVTMCDLHNYILYTYLVFTQLFSLSCLTELFSSGLYQ